MQLHAKRSIESLEIILRDLSVEEFKLPISSIITFIKNFYNVLTRQHQNSHPNQSSDQVSLAVNETQCDYYLQVQCGHNGVMNCSETSALTNLIKLY